MTNPLARVVMNNVVKKTGETNVKTSYERESNLTSKDKEIIKKLINRESEVKEEKYTATVLTLDEAADRVRNRK